MYIREPLAAFISVVLSTLMLLSLTACGGGGGGSLAVNDRAFAVAIQSDGKIVAAGDSYNSDTFLWSVALVRYNSDGSLDSSFGTGGKVLTTINAGARAVAIQSDGKIVTAGSSYDNPGYFVLARYNSNGSLDTSFGNGGVVLTAMGGGAAAVAIQSDGRIVVAGNSYNGGFDFALARYLSNGMLDGSFGSGGAVLTAMGAGVSGLAIQGDLKVLAAGGSYLARYNNIGGSTDLTFNPFGGGILYTGSSFEQTSSVALQADGQILTAGGSYNGGYQLALTRYNKIDGLPDSTFGNGGRAVTFATSFYSLDNTTVVQNNSKIVAAGFSPYQFIVARFDSSGNPDLTFNTFGELTATGGSYWNNDSVARVAAVQSDGKIVVAGSSYKDDANGYDFALVRLGSNGAVDTGFGVNGRVTTGF